jgi:hypothetical protein
MLGCYILCSETLVEVDRLTVEVEDIDSKSKVKVFREVKVEVEDIDNKSKRSTDKILTSERLATK